MIWSNNYKIYILEKIEATQLQIAAQSWLPHLGIQHRGRKKACPQTIAGGKIVKLLGVCLLDSIMTWCCVCSMLQGLVDFDGYYLESDPCLVCNNPEVPYAVSIAVILLFHVAMNCTSISLLLTPLSCLVHSLQGTLGSLLDNPRFCRLG